ACQVSTSNILVTLPTVTSQAFSGVDSVAGTKPFQIGLTCSSGAVVRITLDTATPVAGKAGVIAPSSGGSGGVGVQLLDSSGVTPVQFGVAKTIGATPDGALSVNYFAQYYQTGSTVSAGQLTATATFTLSYQ
ncbi:MAG TPA: fimbrial protein, partial [Rhodanobacter sp.]|nr:fimbrial protein [Rhodanobacter sp.]